MPRPRAPEDGAWNAAARLVLPHYVGEPRLPCRVEDVTWALACWRGQVTPGHPALRILEEYRAWRRGDGDELAAADVSVLMLKLMEITLTVG